MAPRAYVGNGLLNYQTGPVGLDEVIRLDDNSRGNAAPAQAAIWVDELVSGVAIRIVDLDTARVLFAMNVDPNLIENERSRRNYTLSQELDRRSRGDSITQSFVDLALYPGQHLSADFTDQWGPDNRNLSGVTLSLFDPVVGIGASPELGARIHVGPVLQRPGVEVPGPQRVHEAADPAADAHPAPGRRLPLNFILRK